MKKHIFISVSLLITASAIMALPESDTVEKPIMDHEFTDPALNVKKEPVRHTLNNQHALKDQPSTHSRLLAAGGYIAGAISGS